MAPIKRRSGAVSTAFSTESSEQDDDDRSSSASQVGSRKRRRTTNDTSLQEDSDVADGHDTNIGGTQIDLSDDEAFDFLATQAVQEKYASKSANAPAENGILEEVMVENFMCHKHFRFPLGPLINFICGKNGSGKSAILTAISLCLGAKAASTNRGGSLKKFIKEGEETATIQVKIKNHGEGAYRADVYGDSITVERHFAKVGGSGFKIRSATGRIISTKKQELEDICEHFCLQIDNPMNVLTQDMARSFISSARPEDLYKSFIKGVQLEQLDQDYSLIQMSLDSAEVQLDTRKPDIDILKQRRDDANEIVRRFDRHEGVRQELKTLQRQVAWAYVNEREEGVENIEKELEVFDQKIADGQSRVDRLITTKQDAESQAVEARAVYDTADDAVKEVEAQKKEEAEQHKQFLKDFQEIQSEQREIKRRLENERNTISKRQQDIDDEKTRLAERDGAGGAARQSAREDAKTRVDELVSEQQEHESSREALITTEIQAQQDFSDKTKAKSDQENECKKQQDTLQRLRDQRHGQMNSFNPKMPALLQAIKREARFAEPPVGPLGMHIRLLKPEWSSILENYFGGTLSSFIVTSTSDRKTLQDLMRRTGCHSPIYIARTHPIDTDGNEADEEFDTPLRILEIENVLVKNQLIIQHHAEQTLLITDHDEAARVMFGGLPNSRPRNVKRCFCLQGASRNRGFMLSYTRNGEASQDAVNGNSTTRMKSDNAAQLRVQDEAVKVAQDELQNLDRVFYQARNDLQKAKQAVKRHDQESNKLRDHIANAEDALRDLDNQIEADSVERGSLDVFEKQLKDAQRRLEQTESNFQDSVTPYDEKKKVVRGSDRKLKDFDEQIASLREEAVAGQSKAQDLDKQARAADMHLNLARAKLNDIHEERQLKEVECNEAKDALRQQTETAEKFSDRIPVPRGQTGESLNKKFKAKAENYKQFERMMGITKDEAARRSIAAQEAYRIGSRDFIKLQDMAQKLKVSLKNRRDRWRAFRGLISARARAMFVYLLSERSFRGRIDMNHDQRLLQLAVEPDINRRDGDGRGARTLSGGEKSFSQLCLLLAIWEAMGSPIRCLDEFDVYMDAVNRNMSVKLLVEAARQSKERQFIFISPGTKSDLHTFRGADDIHVQE